MLVGCHDHVAAKSLYGLEDALVVGGDIDIADDGAHLLVHPLDDRLAAKHSQWFARKTRRGVAGWYNSYKIHTFYHVLCKSNKNFVNRFWTLAFFSYFCHSKQTRR